MAINIAHITLTMATGGIEKLIVGLANRIDQEKFSLTIGCLDSGGELLEEIQRMGFPCFITGRRPGLDWRLIFNLGRIFSRKQFHIVHAHNQAALFYSALAAKLASIPAVVVTEHSRHLTDRYNRRRIEKKLLSWITTKWVTVSEELGMLAISKDKISPQKIRVIPNGIDIGQFEEPMSLDSSVLKKKLGLPRKSKIIITVSRLHPIKNHALLLNAFARVRQVLEDAQLVIVGDGECREGLERQARDLDLESRIHFLGMRKDVPVLLKISDVFVLCSLTEGLPLSLLEACAAATPVVITDTANRAGFIKAGETGTVTKATTEALARGVIFALKKNDLSKRMALIAKDQVIEKHSLDVTAKEYEKLYLELLS